jgi:hypothetical protein
MRFESNGIDFMSIILASRGVFYHFSINRVVM